MTEQQTKTKTTCIHCGDDCGKHPIIWDEKPFCCNGCQTVYQLLNSKQLGRYYEIEKVPGIKIEQPEPEASDKFNFLDLPEIQTKLLDFSDGGISKVRFFIPSIHCASCIWLLENLHLLHQGVIQSSVNFPKKEVSITFKDEKISLRKLVELLASIHYVPEINPKADTQEQGSKSTRTLLLKMGIAGFSFLNAMIYHFPQYLPGANELEAGFRQLFGWLSFALSIPVLFYCASDYFLSAWKSLKKKIISIDLPIALGLITLFVQSTIEIVSHSGIGYFDSLTGLVFFLLIGKWYQGITYEALTFERNYKSYFPVAVTKLSENGKETIPLEQLQAGDRILVRNQELIPADATIVSGQGNIDYSFVTGESIPVSKQTGDFVFAGGRQSGSAVELLVQKEVEQSYLTQLWNQSRGQKQDEASLSNLINKVSQYFTITIISIALAAAIYWQFADSAKSIFAFTSVLIIACPCALALTIPFTFGSTMRQFGRKGFYLKNADVIEKLYRTTTVVFDKTGTITHAQSSRVRFEGNQLKQEQIVLIRSLCKHSSHPLSKTLFNQLEEGTIWEVENFTELPSLGLSGTVNKCKVNLGSRYFVTGQKEGQEELRTQVWVNMDGKTLGHFHFENRYREGLDETIDELHQHYDLHLISGDNEAERANLLPLFKDHARLNFNQSPTDKLAYVQELQANGKNTLMIGDGLNDAGALMESKVGLVIADNIYNFTPACDAILQASQFGKLDRFLQFTRTSLTIVKLSFAISFLYNLVGISFAVSGNLSPIVAAILMPLSSVTVVAFATFSVRVAASKAML
ncbi:heavy metal translocating P-type ATPase [Mangrovibacterium diazotrophicum]|uniref:Cu+-exporting ATPase n=1 Tax=Mangrovibacterium diazotrophicum TaxID=1261403 RepID=A0A419W7H7_9BACT|nr:heavy metal translocating P-type ATPase metal-binding domain-containing protein [Mangrovibacterium diazotrophicum]RKD91408.1 Cu+-exporting ATPase [Mangrovibacterium diazotrophicum]